MELLPVVRQRFFDANGKPLAGGSVYTYAAGTTTPLATYTDRSGATPNANPVVLDANGEANIWIDTSFYKIVLKDSSGATMWTVDNAALASTAALASSPYRDIVYYTYANSPVTLGSSQNGKLISFDTTGGNIVVNLPQISGQTLPYNVCLKQTVGSTNTVTINRAGTDTINSATSKVLSVAGQAVQLIAETYQSPNDWVVLDLGNIPLDGTITRSKLAQGGIATPNRRTVAISSLALTTDDEIYVSAVATITLLAANTANNRPVTIIVSGTGYQVTVVPSGSDTILGATSQVLSGQYSAVTFFPDGTSLYYAR